MSLFRGIGAAIGGVRRGIGARMRTWGAQTEAWGQRAGNAAFEDGLKAARNAGPLSEEGFEAATKVLKSNTDAIYKRAAEDITRTGGIRGFVRRNPIKSTLGALGLTTVGYKTLAPNREEYNPAIAGESAISSPEVMGARAATEDFARELATQEAMMQVAGGPSNMVDAGSLELAGRAQDMNLQTARG